MNDQQLSPLREFVERWTEIVAQIESGYVLSLDDYLNDIDLRRIIDERLHIAAGAAAGEALEQLRKSIADADDRFRNATAAMDRNIWGEAAEQEEGWSSDREWYYYRVPTNRPDWI